MNLESVNILAVKGQLYDDAVVNEQVRINKPSLYSVCLLCTEDYRMRSLFAHESILMFFFLKRGDTFDVTTLFLKKI